MSDHLFEGWLQLQARRRQDGASSAEYALLITGVATLIVAVVFLFGDSVLGLFSHTCDAIHDGAAGHLAADC